MSFGNERPKRSGRLVTAMPKVGASLVIQYDNKIRQAIGKICLNQTLCRQADTLMLWQSGASQAKMLTFNICFVVFSIFLAIFELTRCESNNQTPCLISLYDCSNNSANICSSAKQCSLLLSLLLHTKKLASISAHDGRPRKKPR